MTRKSFSVRIFLQDGHADGVKILAKSKWTGRGLVIPRASFPAEGERKELAAPGVFVLVETGGVDDLPTLTVGSADPVGGELLKYHQQQDGWSWAYVFSAKDDNLTLAQTAYLQARLVQLAETFHACKLVEQDNAPEPCLPDDEREELEAFLDHILSLLPLFGVTAFERGKV